MDSLGILYHKMDFCAIRCFQKCFQNPLNHPPLIRTCILGNINKDVIKAINQFIKDALRRTKKAMVKVIRES
jgi:hypothetical protein